MNATIPAIIAVLGIVLASASALDAAEEGPEPETYYFYGSTVIGTYDDPDPSITVTWKVTDGNGASVDSSLIAVSDDGRRITVDAEGLDEVVLEQTVSRDSETDTDKVRMIPLHMAPGETRTVSFVDRGQTVKTQTLGPKALVHKGDDHVYPPEVSRIGYVFNGWYLDPGCNERFDSTQPLLESVTVYAGWRESSGGNVTVVVVGQHLAVFNVGPGLKYSIIGRGDSWVSFGVAVQDGYMFAEGSIAVDANQKRVIPVDGVYRIECTQDMDIQLFGTRQYSIAYDLTNARISVDGQDDLPDVFPDGGFRATVAGNGGSLSVRVYSNGTDITASCVNGDRIVLGSASGNIMIVASSQDAPADLPSWMLIAVIIILLAVIVALALRRCRCGTED